MFSHTCRRTTSKYLTSNCKSQLRCNLPHISAATTSQTLNLSIFSDGIVGTNYQQSRKNYSTNNGDSVSSNAGSTTPSAPPVSESVPSSFHDAEIPADETTMDKFATLMEKMDTGLMDTVSSLLPNTHFQHLLEYMHESLGMPWWSAIALTGVTLRLFFLPLSLRSLRNAQKLKNVQPELQKIVIEAKHLSKQDTNVRLMLSQKRRELYKKEGISFMASASTLLQVPFFGGLFFALRGMRDQLHHGGALWFTDLAAPDLGLAAILTGVLLLGNEINSRSSWSRNYSLPEQYRGRARNSTRLMILAVGLIAAQLESAILVYWIPASLIQVSTNLLLTNPNFRKKFGIPDSRPWSIEQLQAYDEKMADLKHARELERMQEERSRQILTERASRINEISDQLYMQFQEMSEQVPELKEKLKQMEEQQQQSGNEQLTTANFEEMASLVNEESQRESLKQVIQELTNAQEQIVSPPTEEELKLSEPRKNNSKFMDVGGESIIGESAADAKKDRL